MKAAVALVAACVALLAVRTANAHIAQAKGSFQDRLEIRASHDRGVLRSIDRQAIREGSWLLLPADLWAERVWHEADLQKALAALQRIRDRWLVESFVCIHGFEGAWNDPNPPYFGGLQMDLQFQHTYAPELLAAKGTADHWTPAEQIAVAIRAYRSGRGFYPWPNTARYCGLI